MFYLLFLTLFENSELLFFEVALIRLSVLVSVLVSVWVSVWVSAVPFVVDIDVDIEVVVLVAVGFVLMVSVKVM